MATSKTKKSKQNRNRKTAAAKAHRRADRKVKSAEIQDHRVTVIEAPIWEYPRMAAAMAEQNPSLTYEEALAVLLAHPAYVSKDCAPPGKMVPARQIQQSGEAVEEFIGSLEELHRIGVMKWDPITRIHHMTSDFEAQILSSRAAEAAPRG
ncbi:hypothetical protein [Rhodococcus globerulus]|uniref:hypothetical protein n=1 Tax=Rhodococcus globerulus TaxID=33008 RepID=UPI0005248EF3|nr:hypothetical protein [Rhodococcus globerulus]PVX59559.1 hypothetical protein C8E04_6131 [Rhodococcus globerulus]